MNGLKHYLVVLILVNSVSVIGQIPGDSLLNYFPLQTGNRWQYRVILEIDFTRDTSYQTFSVLGDTLAANGQVYQILDGHKDRYFRIDTTTQEVRVYYPWDTNCPDSERTAFRLAIPDTGQFISCPGFPVGYFKRFQQVGLLPLHANAHNYNWYDGLTHNYVLSEGFGISFWYVSELFAITGELVAAIVDGVQYGQFIVGVEPERGTARGFELLQNYPNPFNPATHLQFRLAEFGKTTLTIHNSLGEVVRTLVSEELGPGLHTLRWDGNDDKGRPAASGVYYYRLQTGKHVAVRKMVLLR